VISSIETVYPRFKQLAARSGVSCDVIGDRIVFSTVRNITALDREVIEELVATRSWAMLAEIAESRISAAQEPRASRLG
jgi:hypothetical protein